MSMRRTGIFPALQRLKTIGWGGFVLDKRPGMCFNVCKEACKGECLHEHSEK